MNKLTEAQRRVLSSPIYEHFDVWVGYWFASALDGSGPQISTRTLDVLKASGLIERGQNERVFSGRQRCPWRITEAGRLALSQATKGEQA